MNTNREKYTNSKERIVVFGIKCIDCNTAKRGDCNRSVAIECFSNWLDEKASNFDILPCPFCGGTTDIIKDEYGFYGIECPHCDYVSRHSAHFQDAVDEHNRISLAVKEAKK